MNIKMIKVWSVAWDCPLGGTHEHGRFKGKPKRRSRQFTGRGAKGRATAKFNEYQAYNPTIQEYDALVL